MTDQFLTTVNGTHEDLLWRHLKTVPAFRALLRATEARFYQKIDLPAPILDIGCGDGHFAQMTFDKQIDVGTDPWWSPLQKGQQSGMYGQVLQGTGDAQPFPDHYFATAFSNSVLEHIPDVQAVLNETSRVLQPGGKLVITMPSHHFTHYLGGAGFFETIGLSGMAERYRAFFNHISRHVHTDPPGTWAIRLAQAGFRVERWQYYFSQSALRALEWGHVQGLPSAVLHALTGHWIVAPWESSLQRTEAWLRPFYEEAPPEEGAYMLFIARKQADGPIEVNLPSPQPFTLAELTPAEKWQWEPGIAAAPPDNQPLPPAEAHPPPTQNAPPPTAAANETAAPSPSSTPAANILSTIKIGPLLISGTLILLSLFLAMRGQTVATSGGPSGESVRWFVYSFFVLLLLAWQQQIVDIKLPALSLPRVHQTPRRRWFYGLSLLLAFTAYQVASQSQRGGLALLLWGGAIGAAVYALGPYGFSLDQVRPQRSTLITAVVLFIVSYLIRMVNLTHHPFILNGTEASLGLDAVRIIDGTFNNPFATGWLTNPTLPLYILALPLRLFGPSTLALRFLSPLIGALTVAATYGIGKRLWNREVGLTAAVLLMGSHWHIHYSRLGVTNIWDPLAVLLALGLIGIAWQQHQQGQPNRTTWLGAGMAIGLNAYLFTSSHLLPLMLVALVALALLFDWQPFWQQSSHILTAAALALIIALPQLLYYNNNPTVFMERANSLGILDRHSGWLSREAATTGLGQTEIWWQQFWRGMLAFNAGMDTSPSYGPLVPLLSFGLAVFFILGVGLALLQLRQPRYRLLLVWVVITLFFAAVLLENPPNSHRLLIATPALALLAALALTTFGRILLGNNTDEDSANAWTHRLSTPLLVVLALALALAANEIFFYFGRYRAQHTFGDRNTEIAHEMAQYLNSLEGDWTAYFYGPPNMYVGFPTIPFLATEFQANVNLFDVFEPTSSLTPAVTPNQVFIFLPERFQEAPTVQNQFPGGQLRQFSGFHADPLFHAYEVMP